MSHKLISYHDWKELDSWLSGIRIAGASSGIGKATAILFAKLGCRLSLIGRDEQRLKETVAECQKVNKTQHAPESDPYLYVIADLADLKQVDAAFAQTMSHFSQLDILVSTHSLYYTTVPFLLK